MQRIPGIRRLPKAGVSQDLYNIITPAGASRAPFFQICVLFGASIVSNEPPTPAPTPPFTPPLILFTGPKNMGVFWRFDPPAHEDKKTDPIMSKLFRNPDTPPRNEKKKSADFPDAFRIVRTRPESFGRVQNYSQTRPEFVPDASGKFPDAFGILPDASRLRDR